MMVYIMFIINNETFMKNVFRLPPNAPILTKTDIWRGPHGCYWVTNTGCLCPSIINCIILQTCVFSCAIGKSWEVLHRSVHSGVKWWWSTAVGCNRMLHYIGNPTQRGYNFCCPTNALWQITNPYGSQCIASPIFQPSTISVDQDILRIICIGKVFLAGYFHNIIQLKVANIRDSCPQHPVRIVNIGGTRWFTGYCWK